jgi:membrane protein
MTNLKDRLDSLAERADELSGGALSIVQDAMKRFGETRAPEAAAGMAYYALLSLFPLLLVLVAVSGFFLRQEQARQEVVSFITQAIPISEGLITRNIEQILRLRGTVGLVGLVGALWSATAVFTILVRHVSLAWSNTESRGFLEKRLVGLVVVGTLAVLLILSLLSSTALDLLARFQIPLDGGGVAIYETTFWRLLSALVPGFLMFLLFLALYRWVPNTTVRWRAALWGALLAAVGWQVAAEAFSWYVGSGLVNFELAYGSLATVVVLLVWVYLSGLITLLGAHLTAAVDRYLRSSEPPP